MNEFDKKYLKEKIFSDLLRYQNYAARPNLIGLIQQDNCCDSFALSQLVSRKRGDGNLYSAYRNFVFYKKLFADYLNILEEDETIFKSKECFLSQLFINGKYEFLNFNKNDPRDSRFIELKDESVAVISKFTFIDFSNVKDEFQKREKIHTRIKKGEVIRFYDRELTHLEHFDSSSCYLTLSTKGLTDEEFNRAFKASNYRLETASSDSPVEYEVDKLIKKLISLGEEYTKENPTDKIYEVRLKELSFDAIKKVSVNLENEGFITSFFADEIKENDCFEVGKSFVFEDKCYIINSIETNQSVDTVINVSKVI